MKFVFVLQLLLGLGSIMLTCFLYFTSLVSVTGSYTEDEPRKYILEALAKVSGTDN